MDIKLLADGGYSVQPAWEPGADTMARGLPGVAPVLARSHLTAAEFRGMAQQLHDWGDRQEVPCRFHVQVARGDTTDLDTFIRQMAVIDEFFYPKRPK